MRRSGAAHSTAGKHHKREIQLGSRKTRRPLELLFWRLLTAIESNSPVALELWTVNLEPLLASKAYEYIFSPKCHYALGPDDHLPRCTGMGSSVNEEPV
ncbi:hypothetical protein T265_05004 [Opisthorchis viverrini]|uniref:Uncharacterized protein n=1 Tax=Opisthorchis viverrini TaxID=6198 RepID=A0A075AFU6_OPIVI|nr:hypothetical protein T265_05004 [Opisthorchis viverrini]KER28094.1 hypothetical protein T265_05004 [Opisthorchis viverrini]